MSDAPLVRIRDLSRRFDVSPPWLDRVVERKPRRVLTAVADVSFDIPRGSVYALVGELGSGKSTIAKMVVGLLPPSGGTVEIGGVDPAASRGEGGAQMIFQDPYASLNPRWKVRDIIAEPIRARGGDAGGRPERLLGLVGLFAEDANRYPHEFSGGQRQRISIARALASEPRLIVADEPTSALDVSVQAQVINLMSDLREEHGLTYLFISHDLTVVEHIADRIGVLYLGRLVEEAAPAELFEDPKHPYTQMLLEAAPRMDRRERSTEGASGEVPDPADPPSGCVFHPRCPIAVDRCATEVPELRPIRGARAACHLAD